MLTEEERQTVVESREAVRRLHDADDFDFLVQIQVTLNLLNL